ncbi:MAG: HigA family addiction module antidote protein [Acidobacteria bacterium]|nr:HigA family addiction module antidote protein [Acidobacteriota bacterium]
MNTSIKENRRPTHPGAILREDTLPALGLSQTEFAQRIGVSPRTISELLRERSRLTVDLAQRLGLALAMAPEIWLRMQQAVDLYDLRLKNAHEYRRIDKIAA